MAEKCVAQLPPLRVSERLETALMRLAARDERALSDYIRVVLEHHVFGHVGNVPDGRSGCQQSNASQSDARNPA
jgi:hypothetical protein